jgi:hypothetical protein
VSDVCLGERDAWMAKERDHLREGRALKWAMPGRMKWRKGLGLWVDEGDWGYIGGEGDLTGRGLLLYAIIARLDLIQGTWR